MEYLPYISASVNRKGVLDIDAVKGCEMGMAAYPVGGCYGLCYAAKMAKGYGFDFAKSVSRFVGHKDQMRLFDLPGIDGPSQVTKTVKNHPLSWFRIGTMGDPCHDWLLTLELCEWLSPLRIPVIVTKHWQTLPEDILPRFAACNAVINTSISALDTAGEITHRLCQFNRLKDSGVNSVLRIVSCQFGNTDNGSRLSVTQQELFNNKPAIDNPLRIPKNDPRVLCGDIIIDKHQDLGGGSFISIFDPSTYIGTCDNCPEQCGVTFFTNK